VVGRDTELQLVGDLVDRGSGSGAALVVVGEAGIGKSALLGEASRLASSRGARVLSTVGVESEGAMPYAGLHQLLWPVLGVLDQLPARQRGALLVAFGEADGPAADVFVVALATLNLLSESATRGPLVLVADDAHWLDRSTQEVLGFVGRRLENEPVVLLCGVRAGCESTLGGAGLPELVLLPLGDAAAAELLAVRAPHLPLLVRARVLEEAAGCPLALTELPVALGAETAPGAVLPPWLPLTARLEQAFASRASELPPASRTLLLVAALNDSELLSEALAAASVVHGRAVSVDDATPAADRRLVVLDEVTMRFRHPLMRSAIRQEAPIPRRHAAHEALAKVLTDQDRSVWHLAASRPDPDEAVAAELEAAAARALHSRGVGPAVAILERAAQLTDDPELRNQRLLRAAELAFELGQSDVVAELLRAVEQSALTAAQYALHHWIRESFDDGIPVDPRVPRRLADHAKEIATGGHSDLAMKLLRGAALRCFWGEPGPEVRQRVVDAAEGMQVAEDDARLLVVLGTAAPIERAAVVTRRLRALATPLPDVSPAYTFLLGHSALMVGALDVAERFIASSLEDLRAQGRLGIVARALLAQAWCAIQLGDLSVAIPAAEEAARLAAETSQPLVHACARAEQAVITALRGEEGESEKLAAEAEQFAVPAAANAVLALVQIARGWAALADGRHSDAFSQLGRVFDPTDPAHHLGFRCTAVSELAEAAAFSEHGDIVRGVVADVTRLGADIGSPWLEADALYCRALLADGTEAEAAFQAALQADMRRSPFIRARTLLAYGGWLRRHRRPGDARAPLRSAREVFDALGMAPWGERARQELRATGESSPRPASEARDHLTPQELQIARMAAEGLTNREIGQRLYLSHRTVGSHLYRIFPKLGVTSRSELAGALGLAS
jgi:DNA-binding CsgD family transcriptional regulator